MSNQDRRPDGRDRGLPDAAWSIMSYLISGILVWGGVGWLVDRWTGHSSLFLPIGVVFGAAAAIYLIFLRYDKS
jgi:ATP synthase protein I